jgi:threonine/homoserine/homoserine lactone efflux protein
MDTDTLRQGILIGFAVAAPVGPIGVLVIQRSLGGARLGLATGLGAAVADAVYALAGALATSAIVRLLASAWAFELAGGVALAWLAARSMKSGASRDGATAPPASLAGVASARAAPRRLARAFGETLLLTLANPATILSFAAVSASQGLARAAHAAAFSVGVLAGSAAWWLLLSVSVRFASKRLTPRAFRRIHLASTAVLVVFAVFAIAAGVRGVGDLAARTPAN